MKLFNNVKRMIEVTRMTMPKVDTLKNFMFEGIVVYVCSDRVFKETGCDDTVLGAYVDWTGIFINEYTYNSEYRSALLAHELAHIELKHAQRITEERGGDSFGGVKYLLEAWLGYGLGLELEKEADELALSKGYDILSALKSMSPTRAVVKRIKNIEENM